MPDPAAMRLTAPSPASQDGDVLSATARAIGVLHSMAIPYADVFSPLHDDGIRTVLCRLNISIRGEALGTQDVEAVSPPVFGRFILLFSTDIDDKRRAFAVRHGMGHVVAGHVSETTYMRNREDHMDHDERVADTFALCDLLPFHRLDEMRTARVGWRVITHEVASEIRAHTLHWLEARVADRAALRVALYRCHGY